MITSLHKREQLEAIDKSLSDLMCRPQDYAVLDRIDLITLNVLALVRLLSEEEIAP